MSRRPARAEWSRTCIQDGRQMDPRFQVVAPSLRLWWDAFKIQWSGCRRCPLSKHRERIVHFRGIIPARILLIGEAPGPSEDEIGRPFVGPAGKLLDTLLEQAGLQDGDYCLINTVACYPLDKESGTFRRPEKSEIKTCNPRFVDLVKHVAPSLIVLLGQVAASAGIERITTTRIVELTHPSALLRSQSGAALAAKRFVFTLREALEALPIP